MDYAEALRRTYALASRGVRLGLERVRVAADALGTPQSRFPAIQIAGTNGKGTLATVVAHAAVRAGLRVGLFTSPHLHRFTERIRIDGREVDEPRLADHLTRVLALADGISPIPLTFFETATLAAFGIFAESAVDLAVLEVGLGGRLDATSIAEPAVCVITSIGLDHTDLLGSTITEIAREKAAIARHLVPLVTGSLAPEALNEVERVAATVEAPLAVLGRDFDEDHALRPPWPGAHQRRNAAVALTTIEHLTPRFPALNRQVLVESLPTTVWPARYEVVPDGERSVILDGAHNLEATMALVDSLRERRDAPDVLVFGALRGKPIDQMLEVLTPLVGDLILAPPPIDRAFDPRAHADKWRARIAPSIGAALASIGSGTVLVTGSLFAAAEARRVLLGATADPQVGL